MPKIKISQYLKTYFDARSAILYILAIIALAVTWTSIKIIDKNYQLQKRITVIQQEVDVMEQQTKNQRLKNEYYKTDAFLELAARRYFSKASPDEKLILVPKDVAAKYTHPPAADQQEKDNKKDRPQYIKNWQAWINFFTHKQQIETD